MQTMIMQNIAISARDPNSLHNEKPIAHTHNNSAPKVRWFKGSVKVSALDGRHFSETIKKVSHYYPFEMEFDSPECGLYQRHLLASQYLPNTESAEESFLSLYLRKYRARPTTVSYAVAQKGDHARIEVRVAPGRVEGWVHDNQLEDADIILGQQVHPFAFEAFTLLTVAIKAEDRDFAWSDPLAEHFKQFKLEPVMTERNFLRR
jgi:hypothetical protein